MSSHEIKYRQHYVFQAYLRGFEDTNQQVWVCKKDEKRVFNTGTDNVLNKRLLYETRPLSKDDRAFMELMMRAWGMGEKAKSEMNKHMDAYQIPLQNQAVVERLKDVIANKFPHNSDAHRELEEQIKNLENIAKAGVANTEEEFHSDYEGQGIDWIRKIEAGDLGFYYNEGIVDVSKDAITDYPEKYEFMDFLCVQFFRTVQMRDIIEKNVSEMLKFIEQKKQAGNEQAIKLNFDTGSVEPKNVLHHMIWADVAALTAFLIRNKAHLTVLHNDTSLPFLTSDQPIMNLKSEKGKETEELVLYYPLTPFLAITVNDGNKENHKHIDKRSDIDKLNLKMLENSNQYLVADRKELLDGIIDMYM